MSTLNLTNLGLFDNRRVELLNDLVSVNKQLMPHVVAAAIGCQLGEAMSLLLFLYGKDVVDGYLLIYHSKHLDVNFARRPLKSGLPDVDEMFCQICEEEISGSDEILYDFEFVLKQDVYFEL